MLAIGCKPHNSTVHSARLHMILLSRHHSLPKDQGHAATAAACNIKVEVFGHQVCHTVIKQF